MNKKTKAARFSIFSNLFLITLKAIAGILSGSVSILSEAIHSFLDLIASFIAYFAVKISSKDADARHPYGHGKFENVSGVVEAILILVAAIWIIYEAVKKLYYPDEVDYLIIGIIVMLISGVVNLFVSRYLYRVSHETDSIALEADALHLKTDVYTSFGVAIGLFIIYLTGFYFLDSIIALSVALLIIAESFKLLKKAFNPLVDEKLSDSELNLISEIIQSELHTCMSFHMLRSRKSGDKRYIDFHLEVPGNYSVEESHLLCDQIENAIKVKIPNIEATIHIEPCSQSIDKS